MRKKVTYRGIMGFDPCYDPTEIGMPKSYSATIPEFIKEYRDKVEDEADIIWLLCREQYMTDRDQRLFAVWCARESLKLVDEPDERSINACDVAERYANGNATKDELTTAWAAAWDAARAAAWDAAEDAAWAAARSAAWDAAEAAARDAAGDAAGAAAWAAARSAAWDAARDKQIDHLLTYFK